MLPERSALSCFSFTAQFQVPAYSLTFSAYEFPRNVPPFTGTFPHLAAYSSHNCRLAPDKRRKRNRPGFEPRGGMGRAAWGEETICTMRLKVDVPHRKERGHSNGRYHDWRSWSHPTRRSESRRTLSSEELGDEIRLLPGRQSHRHPVFDHCALDWIGGSGVVVADTAAIGLPEQLLRHQPRRLPAIHHRARHDHGDLSAHRAVPGGLRELPDPADGGRPGHGFSLREHGELLGLSARGAAPGGELLHAGRSHGLRLDLVPTPSHPLRHPGAAVGHHPDALLPDSVYHRLHHGRIELCGDGVAGAHAGDDADAHAPDSMGDFH